MAPCHSITGILVNPACVLRYLASGWRHVCINYNGATIIYNALETGKKGATHIDGKEGGPKRTGNKDVGVEACVWREVTAACSILASVPSPISYHKM
jgi:hypothetical protein